MNTMRFPVRPFVAAAVSALLADLIAFATSASNATGGDPARGAQRPDEGRPHGLSVDGLFSDNADTAIEAR